MSIAWGRPEVSSAPSRRRERRIAGFEGVAKTPWPSPSVATALHMSASIAPVFADVGFDFLGQGHELQRPGRIVAMRKRPLEKLESGVRRGGFACASRY